MWLRLQRSVPHLACQRASSTFIAISWLGRPPMRILFVEPPSALYIYAPWPILSTKRPVESSSSTSGTRATRRPRTRRFRSPRRSSTRTSPTAPGFGPGLFRVQCPQDRTSTTRSAVTVSLLDAAFARSSAADACWFRPRCRLALDCPRPRQGIPPSPCRTGKHSELSRWGGRSPWKEEARQHPPASGQLPPVEVTDGGKFMNVQARSSMVTATTRLSVPMSHRSIVINRTTL